MKTKLAHGCQLYTAIYQASLLNIKYPLENCQFLYAIMLKIGQVLYHTILFNQNE